MVLNLIPPLKETTFVEWIILDFEGAAPQVSVFVRLYQYSSSFVPVQNQRRVNIALISTTDLSILLSQSLYSLYWV